MAVEQLTLKLALRDDATFDNFYPGENNTLVAHCKAFCKDGPLENFIYLWGPPASGKTHLLQSCCHAIPVGAALYIDFSEPHLTPDVLVDLEYWPALCLDNITEVIGRAAWEQALFDLYNRSRERHARWLVSATLPPAQILCSMADLRSRLSWGLTLALTPLADDQKLAALQMRAQRRGLNLSDESGHFLLNHYPRDMAALFSALETLDQAALAAHRRLTIPFIKQVLNKSFQEGRANRVKA